MRILPAVLSALILVKAAMIVPEPPKTETPAKQLVRRSTDVTRFLKHMGRIEGLGSYTSVGGAGKNYWGMYQFHPKTLQSLGIRVDKNHFLENAALQDSAMILYMKSNAYELRSIINKFSGKTVNGVRITKAGILAGAHLVGSAGVASFFYPEKYQYATVDGNGVNVSTYMKQFEKYNLGDL